MENTSLTQLIHQELDLDIPSGNSIDEIRAILVAHLSFLIDKDFNQLVLLLYRIDIDEEKLKKVLLENQETDAAPMIADLIIERQLQKIRSRQEFRQRDNTINDDEKW